MATPIGHWTTVPLQRVSGEFQVGVVCAHKDGIQKVAFSVNGGDAVDVTAPSWESQRDDWVWCYVLTIDCSQESDGDMTVDATVYADDGETPTTYALAQITLRNNDGATLDAETAYVATTGSDSTGDGTVGNPFATIYKAIKSFTVVDGATIFLQEGDYTFGNYAFPQPTGNTEWFIITTAAGASRANTRITASHGDGLRCGNCCLRNLTLIPSTGFANGVRNARSGGTQQLWYDGCVISGDLNAGNVRNVNWHNNGDWEIVYGTSCECENVRITLSGAAMMRGCTLTRITEFPCRNPNVALNLEFYECSNQIDDGTYSPGEVILFAFTVARDQCVIQHVRGYDNRAGFIDQVDTGDTFTNFYLFDIACLKNADGAGNVNPEFNADLTHFLMHYCTIGDDVIRWVRPDLRTYADCQIKNCWLDIIQVITSGDDTDLEDGITWDYINYEGPESAPLYTPGTNLTEEETDEGMEDDDGGDYRLLETADAYEFGTVLYDLPTGSRGPRNATNPDLGAFIDATQADGGFGESILSNDGTAAFTIPVPTQNVSGTVATEGTSAFTIPLPTQAASGLSEHQGTSAFTAPVPTQNVSGLVSTEGTAAFTIPLVTQNVSGTVATEGTAAFTIPLVTQNVSGLVSTEGTAAFAIPLPTQNVSGISEHQGTSAFTIPLPTQAVSGTAGTGGTSAFTLPVPTQNASGISEHQGTSAFTLPAPTQNVSGSVETTGTTAFTAPIPTQNVSGTVRHIGTITFTIPVATQNVSGISKHQGTSAFTLPVPTQDATSLSILDAHSIGRHTAKPTILKPRQTLGNVEI